HTVVIRKLSENELEKPIIHYCNRFSEQQGFAKVVRALEEGFAFHLNENEQNFLSFPINVSNSQTNIGNQFDEKFLRQCFSTMLKKIESTFTIEFDERVLYEKIKIHLFCLINRAIFFLDRADIFNGEIQNKYPFAYEMAKIGLKELGRILQRKIEEKEIGYLAIYFELMLEKNGKDSLDESIAVVTNTEKGVSLLVKRQIQRMLGDEINVLLLTESDYLQHEKSEFCAIFTTIPLQHVDKSIPYVFVNDLLD